MEDNLITDQPQSFTKNSFIIVLPRSENFILDVCDCSRCRKHLHAINFILPPDNVWPDLVLFDNWMEKRAAVHVGSKLVIIAGT